MAYWKSLSVKEIPLGGFLGLNEPAPATSRPVGWLSSVSNLVRKNPPSLTTRPGLTIVGSAVAAAVTRGIHQYVNLAGTTVQTLAQAGAQLSYSTGGAWTSITAAAPNKNFTGANLNDLACLFYAGSAPQKWTGAALSALGGFPPQGEFVTESHEQFFVGGILGREGDVDWCDDAAPETWTPAASNNAGSITVSQHAVKWVATDPLRDKVLIWTTKEFVMLNGPETGNKPALWSARTLARFGTPNGKTVQNVNGTWIWLTNSGEKKGFALWRGGTVEVIYHPIATSIGLIDWANIANGAAFRDELGRYVCSVPKSGGTLWFTYDPATGDWLVGSGTDMRAAGVLTASGTDTPLVGDLNGKIYKTTGTTDNGTAIAYEAVIGPTVFDNAFRNHQILGVVLVCSLQAGATMSAAFAANESGSYGTAATVTAGATISKVRVSVPVNLSDVQFGEVWRIKLSGSGAVDVHDVLIRAYPMGGLM